MEVNVNELAAQIMESHAQEMQKEAAEANGQTTVIQVTNIAPQATRDQMNSLFATLCSGIEDLRLYPTIRNAQIAVTSRVAFVKFNDPKSVGLCQHLNNTVFIDRAIIISPVVSGVVPDETLGLQLAAASEASNAALPQKTAKLPPHVINRLEGVAPNAFIVTHDPVNICIHII